MSKAVQWSDQKLVEGLKVTLPISISEQEMDTFAKLSGDYNPIHIDSLYAQKNKLEGRVVYGALLAAQVSRLIGMELPGMGWMWHSVSLQFKSPLYIDERAELTAVVSYVNLDLGLLRLNLEIKREGKLLCSGSAQAGRIEASAL